MTRRDLMTIIPAGAVLSADARSEEPDSRYNRILNDQTFRGKIDSATVDYLVRADGLGRHELMTKLLPLAKQRAHPPLSNYFVGAVALGASGSLYLGQNIEIQGNMLGLAVHAEQAAIANAYMSNETGVKAIAVSAAPCGHCRQFLSEVSLEMLVLIPDLPPMPLSDLLPRSFGPKNLGMKNGAFPVGKTDLRLNSKSDDLVTMAALRAACASYSPYSNSPSGAAFSTSGGRLFAGSYIENAAFNPSLPPLETALASYFAAGSKAGDIQRAVLVESANSGVSHHVTTRSVLTAMAPSAKLKRVLLRS